MTNEEKKELFDNAETLKTEALKLFEGKDPNIPVYALLYAGSQLIKEQKGELSFKEASIKALSLLFHFEDCPDCIENEEKGKIGNEEA